MSAPLTVDGWNQRRRRLLAELHEIQLHLVALDPQIKRGVELKPEEQADIGWQLREICRITDEIRKAAKARMELLGKVFAALRIREAGMAGDDSLLTVKGKFASATADQRVQASIPKAGTPEYKEFCEYLDIPPETVESGVVQFHYQRMADWVTQQIASGKPTPDGLTKLYPVYSTTFRTLRKKAKEENQEDGNTHPEEE